MAKKLGDVVKEIAINITGKDNLSPKLDKLSKTLNRLSDYTNRVRTASKAFSDSFKGVTRETKESADA